MRPSFSLMETFRRVALRHPGREATPRENNKKLFPSPDGLLKILRPRGNIISFSVSRVSLFFSF